MTVRAESIFPVRAGVAGGVPVGSSVPTPSPTATPTPDPSASIAPTPPQCRIPSFVGAKVNTAQTTWFAAGFTTTVTITRPPNGNYTITNQFPAVGGQMADCNTTLMTVYGT